MRNIVENEPAVPHRIRRPTTNARLVFRRFTLFGQKCPMRTILETDVFRLRTASSVNNLPFAQSINVSVGSSGDKAFGFFNNYVKSSFRFLCSFGRRGFTRDVFERDNHIAAVKRHHSGILNHFRLYKKTQYMADRFQWQNGGFSIKFGYYPFLELIPMRCRVVKDSPCKRQSDFTEEIIATEHITMPNG